MTCLFRNVCTALLGIGTLFVAGAVRAEIDTTPLPIKTDVAFKELKFEGWSSETETGEILPLRPILLLSPDDGTNRIFVPLQTGEIYVFPNTPDAKKAELFLDLRKKVVYNDKENEEGFLGMAFHPKFKENGELFVYYTSEKDPHTSIVSRFRVSKDDANKGDPAFEEEILRVKQPFWNHNGGTIVFGPDGYLYIALGDGGFKNDPFNNGQNTKTLLGKILRIDVDNKDGDLAYSIPKDNPFYGAPDKGSPEVWAYGLRNVWRMAFDPKTGHLWAADVGQDIWEEIDIIVKGGNYGWNLREAKHKFGPKGVEARKDLIDPIWEYHHDIGKSITGGMVYRGKKFPELTGMYIYADYVSGKIWALKYDFDKGEVVANRPIADQKLPILSFGEDANGEVYLLTFSQSGKGIYELVPAK